MPRFTRTSRIFGALSLTACLAGSVAAQTAADALARDKDAAAIAQQKAEADVMQAILDAEKMTRPQALTTLKATLLNLDVVSLTPAKKLELKTRMENKIAGYEGRATIVPPEDGAKSKAAVKEAIEKANQETDDVTKGLKKAKELLNDNRNFEATRIIENLAVKYPNNPAVLGLKGPNLTRSNVDTWNQLQSEFAKGWVADQQNIMKSNTPIAQDRVFPPKEEWDRITKLRREATQIKISEREKAILESLNTTVSVFVKDRPFQEAIQEFSNQIKQEIHLDERSLSDAGLDMNRKVNFSGNVSARTALRALLQPQGLTYVVKDEIIQVITLEKAEKEMLTTRSYSVSDLVDFGGPFNNAVQFGPVASYQQMLQNADAIMKLVKDSIDPRCWKEKGGFCSIEFHLPSKSLVVRASTEVHASIGGSFTGKK